MKKYIQGLVAFLVTTALVLFGFVGASSAATSAIDANNTNLQFNNTVKIGQGATVGFSHRYSNVFTGVDALVTLTELSNTTMSNIDRVSTVNNWQMWTNEQIGSGGGYATYRVEFVATGTRTPVLMENFNVNVGDIDARQFVEFTGPSSYTVSQNSQLAILQNAQNSSVPVGAVRFAEQNAVGSTDDDTRFWGQVSYTKVSAVDIKLGAAVGGSALYQVSFGAASWGGTAAAPVTPPTQQLTVSYNANGGTGTAPTSTTLDVGTSHPIKANTFTGPSSAAFLNWNTKADGSGAIYDLASANEIVPTVDTVLYAIWTQTVTLTYHANGGTGSVPAAFNGSSGTNTTIAGNTGGMTNPGYEFIGWNTRSDGTGVPFEPGETLNVAANTDLHAVWRLIPVVPPESPIDIDVEPGEPIGGGEINYVIPDQPYDPTCDPTTSPDSAWSMVVTSLEPVGTTYEVDAGCTPPDGDIYGTTVLPQDVPEGIYEVVYESTNGEKIIRYFEVGPNGSFIGQSNTKPELAKTGIDFKPVTTAIPIAGLLFLTGIFLIALRRRTQIN